MMSERQGLTRALRARVRVFGPVFAGAMLVVGLLGSGPAAARHIGAASGGGPAYEWILLDAESGQVLSEQNADLLTYPASLTKMMTLYLTFEALNQGRIRLDQQFQVSYEAAAHSPSKLGLTPGDTVPLRDLILGVVTRSANDAAAVIAEGLAGSEANFARYMTWKARQLGMQHTWYRNASGLPDPEQRTTARDVARLALALYHQFPREYRYFSTRTFEFRGDVVHTHNHLMEWYQGADGIKTGFVNASGFNLAASAVRDGRRLIGVIMGGRSARSRDAEMASLLDQGFAVLANGGAPRREAPVVVAATPQPTALPAAAAPARPAVATTQIASAAPIPPSQILEAAPARPAVATQAAPAAAEAAATPPRRSGLLTVAKAALRHLAPVAKAEAATVVREAPASADDWAIQLGAFRAEAAAEQAARNVAGLPAVKGKPHQVVAPARNDPNRLYRARLLHFSSKGAQAACAELHKRGIACSVVKPGSVKVASK